MTDQTGDQNFLINLLEIQYSFNFYKYWSHIDPTEVYI